MAQLVKHLTLDFSSSHDLTVHEFEPHMGLCADSVEPSLDSVSLSLYPSPTCSLYLIKIKKINLKKCLKKFFKVYLIIDHGMIFGI